jgi:hypothetical protein
MSVNSTPVKLHRLPVLVGEAAQAWTTLGENSRGSNQSRQQGCQDRQPEKKRGLKALV